MSGDDATPSPGIVPGLVLLGVAIVALIVANSAAAPFYQHLRDLHFDASIGGLRLDHSVAEWINDGPMAIFFLLVSLEIKRELAVGALSRRADAILPAVAALGGIAVPALIYLILAQGHSGVGRGWAIPSATDIAFSLGVLALLGARAVPSLRAFLAALAILDDLGAIIIIALFYSSDLSVAMLGLGALGVIALLALNKAGARAAWPYLLLGIYLWICLLSSGLHPTLAGVAVGLAIPVRDDGVRSASARLEHALAPWVNYAIVPLFAFANAGVALSGADAAMIAAPIPGIALGLLLGKPIGIVGASWIAIRAGAARLPVRASWGAFWGVGALAGIGFTMSLFIGDLAFADPDLGRSVRIGVLMGSIAAALVGAVTLVLAKRKA